MFSVAPFLLAFSQILSSSSTQPAAPSAVPTPADAEQRMVLAHLVNGLHGFEKPWHLKASYEWFGPDGQTKDKGTYEEWRFDEKQYRVAFHSPLISSEEYGTDHGIYFTGNARPKRPLSEIHRLVSSPMPEAPSPEHAQLRNYEHDFGVGKMPCTEVIHEGSQPSRRSVDVFCFAQNGAALFYRDDSNDTLQTLFEHFMLAGVTHFIAHDTQMFVAGSPWLRIHVDDVRSLAAGDMSQINPPPDAQLASPPNLISQVNTVTTGPPTHKEVPKYPVAAKQMGIQGRVIIACTIDKTGHAKDVSALAGPSLLQQPAVDAVRLWVWEPYKLNGEPVEVESTINIIFNLSR